MISAFEHPFLSGLLGDDKMSGALGLKAELAAMLAFETALAQAEAKAGVIPAEAASAISAGLARFKADIAALKAGVARDGVVVPELVRQLRAGVGAPHDAHVHFGATSQDVIDSALMIRLRAALDLLGARTARLVSAFEELAARGASRRMMGHTRMQAAIEIDVTDRIDTWMQPLSRHLERLETIRQTCLAIQFGGAAGTLEKLGDKGPTVRASLAQRLGLADAPQWQSQRDRIAEIGNWLSMLTGSLGKFGQDIALMAQSGGEIELAGGGGSSAMPHKQNPVSAETLVALARFNATQVSALHHSLVHEQERSGAAWTLEWMILPQMAQAAGAATLRASALTSSIRSLGR
ncbi:MAG: 3-carboxy-cis,cis-muconate cycloisomerase [Mesorhizobium sp.]